MSAKTNDLITLAADQAMASAAEYIARQHLKLDAGKVCAALRAKLPDAIKQGLADAKQAFDANMGQVGEATFILSVRQAGIEAAKEVQSLAWVPLTPAQSERLSRIEASDPAAVTATWRD